jgi:CrcB protein
MKQILLVALGSSLGAVARYKLGGWILHHALDYRFPLGTFAVNVLGCLAAGILAALVEKQGFFSPDTRLFLFTGFLGGFTTFSAFGIETVTLLKRGDMGIAFLYVTLSVLCGVGGLWLAMEAITRRA